jgi:hypothetical protein
MPDDKDLLSDDGLLALDLRRTRLATVLGRRALFPLDELRLCDVTLSAGPCEGLSEKLERAEGALDPCGVTKCSGGCSTKCLMGESSEMLKLVFGEAISMC